MTDPDTADADPLVTIVTEAIYSKYRNKRVTHILDFRDEVAQVVVAAVRAHQAATPSDFESVARGRDAAAQALRDARADTLDPS